MKYFINFIGKLRGMPFLVLLFVLTISTYLFVLIPLILYTSAISDKIEVRIDFASAISSALGTLMSFGSLLLVYAIFRREESLFQKSIRVAKNTGLAQVRLDEARKFSNWAVSSLKRIDDEWLIDGHIGQIKEFHSKMSFKLTTLEYVIPGCMNIELFHTFRQECYELIESDDADTNPIHYRDQVQYLKELSSRFEVVLVIMIFDLD